MWSLTYILPLTLWVYLYSDFCRWLRMMHVLRSRVLNDSSRSSKVESAYWTSSWSDGAAVVHDQLAPAYADFQRYIDSRFDSRFGVLHATWSPGHLCRLRPGDAHSCVSDGVELLRSTASISHHLPISSRRPSWCSVDSTMVMVHWSASRPTLSADSSRCRTQRRDFRLRRSDHITDALASFRLATGA